MKAKLLREALEAMAQSPNITGCALVEVVNGMVWHSAGDVPQLEQLGEAMSDYWRLSQRLQPCFAEIGPLKIGVFLHESGRVTTVPCGEGMIMVAISGHASEIDWAQWRRDTAKIADLVNGL